MESHGAQRNANMYKAYFNDRVKYKINVELNPEVTFLYQFLLLNVSFCTTSQSNTRNKSPNHLEKGKD